MLRSKLVVLAICLSILSTLPSRAFAMDLDEIFVGVVEDREEGANLLYVFVLSLVGQDIAGGRVRRPGNPTPICELEFDAVFLGFDATCNIEGSSVADLCSQIGFGDFIVEIDAAIGSDDTVTVFYDAGCTDAFPGNVVITSPTSGGDVPTNPGPNTFCFDCDLVGGCPDFWQMEVDGDTGGAEFLRETPVPGCWDPGFCLSQGFFLFRASSIQLFGEAVPQSTDLGDDFFQTSFYQNADLEYFNVSAATPTTPAAIPSGIGASFPVLLDKLSGDGSDLELFWDEEACCANIGTHLVYGTSADLPNALGGTYSLDGSQCSIGLIGPNGTFVWNSVPAPAPGDFLWWLVLSNDGADTEGSWGLDSNGQERNGPGGSVVSSQCGMTARSLSNVCGR